MKTKGWQKVFGFTLIQYIKTKSFIIGTIIMCLIVALLAVSINILPALLGDEEEIFGGNEQEPTSTAAVYIYDECGALADEDYGTLSALGLKVIETELTAADMMERLESAANEAMILITAQESDGQIYGYNVKTYYSPDAEDEAVDYITSVTAQTVDYRNLINAGVTPENYALTQRDVYTSKVTAGKGEWNMFESMLNYFVPIVVSLVLFMMIFAYGQTVAQSIATEKTSRVMELLLTSVRPLAVVIGKVLSMGLVCIMQFLLVGTVGGIAFAISAPFGIGGELMNIMNNVSAVTAENAEIAAALENTIGSFGILHVALIFLIFILGFVFYSLIAALVGASVSRMEDLPAAMQPYSILGVVGMYLAYFPVIGNLESLESGAASVNGMQIFSYYFPLSSPFALPSALLLGHLSMVEVVIAIAILAAFTALVAVLVAKVYEMIILHNGNLLKFKDIIAMAIRK